jgi:hypothetical protein
MTLAFQTSLLEGGVRVSSNAFATLIVKSQLWLLGVLICARSPPWHDRVVIPSPDWPLLY